MASCPSCGYYTSNERIHCVPCTRTYAMSDLNDPRLALRDSVRNRVVGADYKKETLAVFTVIYFAASGVAFYHDPFGRMIVAAVYGLIAFVAMVSVLSALLMLKNLVCGQFRGALMQMKNMVLAALLVGGIFVVFPTLTGEKASDTIRNILGSEYGYSKTAVLLDSVAMNS